MNLLYRAGFMHEMTDKAGEMTDKQVEELKFGKIPYRNCEDVKRGQKCPQSTWDNKGTVTREIAESLWVFVRMEELFASCGAETFT